MALLDQEQVRPLAGRPPVGGVRSNRLAVLAGLEGREQLALVDAVADRDRKRCERAARERGHLMLHLHRLEHDHDFARGDALARRPRKLHDEARKRREDLNVRAVRHARIIAQATSGRCAPASTPSIGA